MTSDWIVQAGFLAIIGFIGLAIFVAFFWKDGK